MTKGVVAKNKVCNIQGCHNKATYSKKVKLLEQLDYGMTMKLCTRHKNHFKGDPLVKIDLKAYGEEILLGKSKDTDKQRIVNDTFDYMRKQAKTTDREESVQILINAAKQIAKAGDGKFLFGFYFGVLFALSSFRDSLGRDESRQRRATQIRSEMSLREPYAKREHPDTSGKIVEVCRCGHEMVMHDYGQPRGACFTCLCSRYEFEQRITRAEASDLESLMNGQLRKD